MATQPYAALRSHHYIALKSRLDMSHRGYTTTPLAVVTGFSLFHHHNAVYTVTLTTLRSTADLGHVKLIICFWSLYLVKNDQATRLFIFIIFFNWQRSSTHGDTTKYNTKQYMSAHKHGESAYCSGRRKPSADSICPLHSAWKTSRTVESSFTVTKPQSRITLAPQHT